VPKTNDPAASDIISQPTAPFLIARFSLIYPLFAERCTLFCTRFLLVKVKFMAPAFGDA